VQQGNDDVLNELSVGLVYIPGQDLDAFLLLLILELELSEESLAGLRPQSGTCR
jgi:hypothetical protein